MSNSKTYVITENIKVSVAVQFLPEQSTSFNYVFNYHITILNMSKKSAQLLSRKWHIFDSNSHHRVVQGDGVVGVQPIIQPGESFTYQSYCVLETEMGSMYGTYTMQHIVDGETFEVAIPLFKLELPSKMN